MGWDDRGVTGGGGGGGERGVTGAGKGKGEGGLRRPVREGRGTVKYPSGDGLPEILETRLACVTV